MCCDPRCAARVSSPLCSAREDPVEGEGEGAVHVEASLNEVGCWVPAGEHAVGLLQMTTVCSIIV